jgi:2-C-methyl-D-erythritol 4-phosphate cytidylyltransferase
MTRQYAIIVAGGSGARMSENVPKQFLLLSEKPILVHTIERWLEFCPDIPIILVLPHAHLETWKEMTEKFNIKANITVVNGGKERFHSVQNALRHVPDGVLVAVHDAVRPLVSVETIETSFQLAEKHGSAVPYTVPQASMRIENDDGINVSINRKLFRIIQTPQTFSSSKLKQAYQQPYRDDFTDDASVWEKTGEKVWLFEGNEENIKITTPWDLKVAECFLKG